MRSSGTLDPALPEAAFVSEHSILSPNIYHSLLRLVIHLSWVSQN